MRLQTKLLVLVSGLFLVLCGAILVLGQGLVLPTYTRLEEEEIHQSWERTRRLVDAKARDLASGVSASVQANQTLHQNQTIDGYILFDAQKTPTLRAPGLTAAESNLLLQHSRTLIRKFNNGRVYTEVTWTNNTAWITRFGPVEGVAQNCFAFKRLDRDFMRDLQDVTHLQVLFVPATLKNPTLNGAVSNSDSVVYRQPIANSLGETGGYMLVKGPRFLSERFLNVLTLLVETLVAAATMVLLGTMWMITKHVTRPIGEITEAAKAAAMGRRIWTAVDRTDEIGELGNALNQMVEKLSTDADTLQAQNVDLAKAVADARRANDVLHMALDGVAVLDSRGVFKHANVACCQIFGVVNLVGENIFEFLSSAASANYESAAQGALAGAKTQLEMQAIQRGGSKVSLDVVLVPAQEADSDDFEIHAFFKDVTKERRLAGLLSHQAMHDQLTGLGNRTMLERRLTAHKPKDGQVGILSIDLDDFQYWNDTYGHHFGDSLLKEIGITLQDVVERTDACARLGGDEFVILLNSTNEALMKQSAQRIIAAIHRPFKVEGRVILTSCSIGGYLVEPNVSTLDALRNADTALHHGKLNRKGSYVPYDEDMRKRVVERVKMEENLRHAIERDELSLMFQPLVSLDGHRIVGCETLLRWTNAELGSISPVKFIPIAEETGQIEKIGEWVLRKACVQAAQWVKEYGHFIMNVNLSQRQLLHPGLMDTIRGALSSSGLDPKYLNLEITETLAVRDFERTLGVLKEIKSLGCSLSIDDFGTGYSSLSYLQKLPVDCVKIDRSFVQMIGTEDAPTAIILAIITLCKEMKFKIAGEGVETKEQLDYLSEVGVNLAQGYYFSKPVPQAEFEVLLQQEDRIALPRAA